MVFQPLSPEPSPSLPNLSLFQVSVLVAFFHFWRFSSFPFLVEDPLVQLIEPLLLAFLVNLRVPLGVGFFFIRALVTWNWFRSPSVKKTRTNVATGRSLFSLG